MRSGPPLGDPRTVEQAILGARTFLHSQCPNHQPRLTLTLSP
jgi:hypothetical protein